MLPRSSEGFPFGMPSKKSPRVYWSLLSCTRVSNFWWFLFSCGTISRLHVVSREKLVFMGEPRAWFRGLLQFNPLEIHFWQGN